MFNYNYLGLRYYASEPCKVLKHPSGSNYEGKIDGFGDAGQELEGDQRRAPDADAA
jgi:hypothetical protein